MLVLVGYVHITIYRGEFYLFAEPVTDYTSFEEIIVTARRRGPMSAIEKYLYINEGNLPIIEIYVYYPEVLKENESDWVIIEYDALFSRDKGNSESLMEGLVSSQSLSIELIAASFSIAPKPVQTKRAGTKLPIEFSWEIKPESEGSFSIALDFSNFFEALELPDTTTIEYSVNGEKNLLDENKRQIFDVEVYTFLNISKKRLFFIEMAVSFFGFILLCPWTEHFVKNRAGFQK